MAIFQRPPRVFLWFLPLISWLLRHSSPLLELKFVLVTAILGTLLENLPSLTLGSSPKLIIGCQVFTSSPKLPSGILRLPMLLCKSPLRWSGSISSMLLKIANSSSPLKDALYHDSLDALFSTLLPPTAPCKALAPLPVKFSGLALHDPTASAIVTTA